MLKIYNTLTRQKEVFKPLVAKQVSMYVCGPTVYNYIHIGNARSAVAFDTIRRYLEYKGYQVNYVSNFTDVDDKMIKAAKAEGLTVAQLATRYIDAFIEDTKALNVKPATIHPRATENIAEIIAFIQDLIQKGYAYQVEGDVYYRARRFKDYGELSDQNIDQLEQGASEHTVTEETLRKEDPIDFALWKHEAGDAIAWSSPWGKGRPGWHIECSVMSTKYLGDTIDIHGGGQDLAFPHHENEIAQSEAKTAHKFVNYWMHNGFVTIGEADEKMSKSLGNFVTVHELIETVDPQILRFFMSSTQYRRPIQYSKQNLQKSADNYKKIQNTFENLTFALKTTHDYPENPQIKKQVSELKNAFENAMDDDFNVQNALTVVYDLIKLTNQYLQEATLATTDLEYLKKTLVSWLLIFGINFETETLLDDDIEQLIQKRQKARADKDFKTSDEIRDTLKAQGILLEDTPQGVRWKRK